MAKLYVFGIGGTGSRVIKSLVMLLAAGVKLENNFDTVVPIIIDPDTANGDLNRTADILTKYQNIYSKIGQNNKLFGTKISTLTQLTNGNVGNLSDHFKFKVDGSGQKFGDSIDYNGLDDDNKALIDLLFSTENIEADMTVGFKGNPNIGSVVLNKIVDSQEYREFTNSFNQGDAIFIISSIFGGTGASGFPLLLKNLRNEDAKVTNSNLISKSVIGGISYLPYFKVSENEDGENEIDSSTFFGKAKAALSYYEHAIFKNNISRLNAFYHLGDNANNNMKYAEGKADQKNDAHFLELAGALAIFDFAKNLPVFDTLNKTDIKEFGIEKGDLKLRFDHLGKQSKELIRMPLSKVLLLYKFLEKSKAALEASRGSFNKNEKGIQEGFYNSDFYQADFIKFLDYFIEWLTEMKHNEVGFAPYHDNQDHDNLLEFIIDKDISKKGIFSLFNNKATGDLIIKNADKVVKQGHFDNETIESRFIKIFDEVLEKQISEIIN